MSDNKDITKLEQKILNAIRNARDYEDFYENQFIDELRQIMPHTCSETERKFLDRVRENFKYDARELVDKNDNLTCTRIHQIDFPDIDLKELVNE